MTVFNLLKLWAHCVLSSITINFGQNLFYPSVIWVGWSGCCDQINGNEKIHWKPQIHRWCPFFSMLGYVEQLLNFFNFYLKAKQFCKAMGGYCKIRISCFLLYNTFYPSALPAVRLSISWSGSALWWVWFAAKATSSLCIPRQPVSFCGSLFGDNLITASTIPLPCWKRTGLGSINQLGFLAFHVVVVGSYCALQLHGFSNFY